MHDLSVTISYLPSRRVGTVMTTLPDLSISLISARVTGQPSGDVVKPCILPFGRKPSGDTPLLMYPGPRNGRPPRLPVIFSCSNETTPLTNTYSIPIDGRLGFSN